MTNRDEDWRELTAIALVVPMHLTLFVALLIIPGYQFLEWLRSGQWPALSISHFWELAGLGPVHTDWVGLQIIIDRTMALHISIGLVGIVVLWFVVGNWFYSKTFPRR